MFEAKKFEQLLDGLRQVLPPEFTPEVEKNFRAALTAALAKLDLVTREEFEVQSQVLAHTRTKLDALERQVAEMEKMLRQ